MFHRAIGPWGCKEGPEEYTEKLGRREAGQRFPGTCNYRENIQGKLSGRRRCSKDLNSHGCEEVACLVHGMFAVQGSCCRGGREEQWRTWWRWWQGGFPGLCKTLGLHCYRKSQLVFSKLWPLSRFSKAKRHPRVEAGACHLGDFAASGTRKTN